MEPLRARTRGVLRLDPQPFTNAVWNACADAAFSSRTTLGSTLRAKVDPAEAAAARLARARVTESGRAAPTIRGATGGAMPWSRLLREAKNPPRDEDERAVILKITCGFLCRSSCRHTAAAPCGPGRRHTAGPERYARRGMSLPDHLAAAIESQLALPWPMEALVKTKSIELRGLSRAERRQA